MTGESIDGDSMGLNIMRQGDDIRLDYAAVILAAIKMHSD